MNRDPLGKRALFSSVTGSSEEAPVASNLGESGVRESSPSEEVSTETAGNLGESGVRESSPSEEVSTDNAYGAGQPVGAVRDEIPPGAGQPQGDPGQPGAGHLGKGAAALGALLGRLGGPIQVECSRCGKSTETQIADLVLIHLPLPIWLPGRGSTHLVTCPACHRRAWASVSYPKHASGTSVS